MSLYDETSIENVRPEHWAEVFKLWDLSFGMPYDIHAQEEYVKRNLSLCLAAIHNNKVAAVAAVIDFEMMFAGKAVPCAGISAVATHPSYRRQGLTRKLLQNILSQLYEKRIPLASLWPFSYQFYESFGWSVTDLQCQTELTITDIPKVGSPLHYDEIAVENCDSLFELHNEWCKRWNLSLARNKFRWQRMFSKPDASWFILKHQDGYMLANLNEGDKTTLVIREWCYLSEKAFQDGLAVLRQMDSQFSRVRWTSGETDSLLKLGVPPNAPTMRLIPGMMTRVVHPQAFEEILPVKLTGARIVDPLEVSSTTGPGENIGPGALVQLVTGFFQQPPSGALGSLYKIGGNQKAFSVEKF